MAKLREGDDLEDTGIDGMIILRLSSGSGMGGGMGWMDLAHNRDRWWALVKGVMNSEFHEIQGTS